LLRRSARATAATSRSSPQSLAQWLLPASLAALAAPDSWASSSPLRAWRKRFRCRRFRFWLAFRRLHEQKKKEKKMGQMLSSSDRSDRRKRGSD